MEALSPSLLIYESIHNVLHILEFCYITNVNVKVKSFFLMLCLLQLNSQPPLVCDTLLRGWHNYPMFIPFSCMSCWAVTCVCLSRFQVNILKTHVTRYLIIVDLPPGLEPSITQTLSSSNNNYYVMHFYLWFILVNSLWRLTNV
jgi:hypothetical protein